MIVNFPVIKLVDSFTRQRNHTYTVQSPKLDPSLLHFYLVACMPSFQFTLFSFVEHNSVLISRDIKSLTRYTMFYGLSGCFGLAMVISLAQLPLFKVALYAAEVLHLLLSYGFNLTIALPISHLNFKFG